MQTTTNTIDLESPDGTICVELVKKLQDAGVTEVLPPGRNPEEHPKTLWDLLGADGWVNFFRRADSLGWRVFSDDDLAGGFLPCDGSSRRRTSPVA